jgi:hypothetical protein
MRVLRDWVWVCGWQAQVETGDYSQIPAIARFIITQVDCHTLSYLSRACVLYFALGDEYVC